MLQDQENLFCWSLLYNGNNSFFHANDVKQYQFKTKDFEKNPYLLCLRNFSEDFTINNMKKARLNGHKYVWFSCWL